MVKDLRQQREDVWSREGVGGNHLGHQGQRGSTAPTAARDATEPQGKSPRRPSAALFESNNESTLRTNTLLQPRQSTLTVNAAPTSNTQSSSSQQTLLLLLHSGQKIQSSIAHIE
jgi:hypothetical protein